MIEINPVLIGTLAVLNIPVYYLLYRLIFKDWNEFRESLSFWTTLEVFSLLRGELPDLWFEEFKLAMWLIGCIAAVVIQHLLFLPMLTD